MAQPNAPRWQLVELDDAKLRSAGGHLVGQSEGFWGDVARTTALGVNDIIAGGAGLAERTLGIGGDARRWAAAEEERFLNEMTPAGRATLNPDGWQGMLANPSSIPAAALRSLPGMLATGAGGALAGGAARGAAIGLGGGARAAGVTSGLAGGAGAAAGGLAMGSGSNYAEMASRIEGMPEDMLRVQSPRYRELRDQGQSHQDASRAVAAEAAAVAFDVAGPTSALEGVVDYVLTRGVGRALRGVRPGATERAATGALSEETAGFFRRTGAGAARGAAIEAPTEFVQSGMENIGIQQGLRELRGGRATGDVFEGVDWGEARDAAIQGAIVGAAMGGTFGAASRLRAQTGVDPAARAALTPPSAPSSAPATPSATPPAAPSSGGAAAASGSVAADAAATSGPGVSPGGGSPNPATSTGSPASGPPTGAAASPATTTVGTAAPAAPSPTELVGEMLRRAPEMQMNAPVTAIAKALDIPVAEARTVKKQIDAMRPSEFEALRPPPPAPPAPAAPSNEQLAAEAAVQNTKRVAKGDPTGIRPLAAAKSVAEARARAVAAGREVPNMTPEETQAQAAAVPETVGLQTAETPPAPAPAPKAKTKPPKVEKAKVTAEERAALKEKMAAGAQAPAARAKAKLAERAAAQPAAPAPAPALQSAIDKRRAQADRRRQIQERWDARRARREEARKAELARKARRERRELRRQTTKARWEARKARRVAPPPAATPVVKVAPKTAAALEAAKARAARKAALAPPGERRKGQAATVALSAEQVKALNEENREKQIEAAREEATEVMREEVGQDVSSTGTITERADENEERASLREEGVLNPAAAVARMEPKQTESGGTTDYEAAAVQAGAKEERAKGSATERRAADLVDKVLDTEDGASRREAAVAAAIEYGRPEAGVKPWKYRTLHDFVLAQIEDAEDPKHLVAMASLARVKTPTPAQTKRMNNLMAKTDPDRVQALREMAAAIENLDVPARRGIEQAEESDAPVREKKVKPGDAASDNLLSGDGTRKAALLADQKARDAREARDKRRDTTSFGPAFDISEIAPHPDDMPQAWFKPGTTLTLRDAAARLRQLTGRNPYTRMLFDKLEKAMFLESEIRIVSPAELALRSRIGTRSRGMFDPNTDTIYVRSDLPPPQFVATLLHEMVHAATYWHVRIGDDASKLVGELHKAAQAEASLDPNAAARFAYQLKNVDEFMAGVFTNPNFQRWLNSRALSPEVAASLGLPRRSTLWDRIVQAIAKLLGLPRVKGVYTLLDASMRATGNLVDERADAIQGTRDLSLEPLDLLDDAGPSPLGRAATTVADTLDAGRAGDWAWRKTLGFRRLDQLVRDYAGLFRDGGLVAFQKAENAIARATEKFRDRFASTVENVIPFLQTAEGRDKLAPLMVRATAAQMHPDKALTDAAHDHLDRKDDTVQRVHAQLAADYAALSDDAKAAYQSALTYFRDVRKEETDALFDRALAFIAPDATAADKAKLLSLVDTPKKLAALEGMSNAQIEALGFSANGLNEGEATRALARIHRMRYVQGPYFPMRRFGDYVVTYTVEDYESPVMTADAAAEFVASHAGSGLEIKAKGSGHVVQGKLYGVEFFESKREAAKRREELIGQHGDEAVSDVESRRQYLDVDSDIPALQLETMEGVVRKAAARRELSSADTKAFIQSIRAMAAQYMPETQAGRMTAYLQRQNVAGASEDMARVLGEHYNQAAARIGYLHEGARRENALTSMRRETEKRERGRPGVQIKQQALLNEMYARVTPYEPGTMDNLGFKATQFGFFWALLSPSLPVVNTAQTWMTASSVLGAKHGFGRALSAMRRAQAEVGFRATKQGFQKTGEAFKRKLVRHDFNMFAAVADHMVEASGGDAGVRALMDALRDNNLVDHTIHMDLHELGGSETATSKARRAVDWMRETATMIPQAVDVNNRVVVAKAAYDLARRDGMAVDKAVDYAIEALRRSEPIYNAHNKARQFTSRGRLGWAAAPLMQFKQGGQHIYDLLVTTGRDAIWAKDLAIRAEARRLLAGILVTHGTASGLIGIAMLEPVRMLLGAMALASGEKEPWDWEGEMRRWMARHVGPEAGEILMRGLPRAMGVDVSNRLGIGGALNLPQIRSFDSRGFTQALGEALLAPAGSSASGVLGGIGAAANGDLVGTAKGVLPRALRDFAAAYELGSGERRDSRGRITDTPDVGLTGVALRSLGFTPSVVAEASTQRRTIEYARRQATTDRQRLIDRWVDASPDRRETLRQRIREHNAAYPAHRISPEQLTRAVAERRRQRAEAQKVGGAYMPRAGEQARWLREQGSFANTGAR